MSLKSYRNFLVVLSIMIIGLMALGAGVRTMNAGLSCPDWPLCFGKVIPDFHPAVWFEFVHRAYAGIVSILYIAALVVAFRRKDMSPKGKKALRRAARFGVFFLALQILMGGLTVLLLVKAVIVTTHLLLATLFLSAVLWMFFTVNQELRQSTAKPAGSASEDRLVWWPKWPVGILPVLVFIQIALGGFVASTYAGSVCVDWPLCNGQWVPTWKGAIGLQIIHRFYAYALVSLFVGMALWALRKKSSLSTQVRHLFLTAGAVVTIQTLVGILNLLYFIPPKLAVLHQSLAMILLGLSLRIWYIARGGRAFKETSKEKTSENPATSLVSPS